MATSQVITCGSGNTPYQTNGEPRYYTCTNVTGGATFKPSLPEGLTLVEGVIKGTPKRSFDTIRIHIKSDGRWGDWFVSCKFSFFYSLFSIIQFLFASVLICILIGCTNFGRTL